MTQNRDVTLDPLSEALAALHMESSVIGVFSLAAPFAIRHPPLGGVVCHLVVSGSCLCRLDEEEEPVVLEAGDVIAFPQGSPHIVASDRDVSVVPVEDLLGRVGHELWRPDSRYHRPVRYASATDASAAVVVDLVSRFHEPRRNPLLRALPSVIHLKAAEGRVLPELVALAARIANPQSPSLPGYAAMVSRVADMVFIQAVRVHMTMHKDAGGWLGALVHPKIGRALQAIYRAPERDWTVADLAATAGMSRTPFAQKFHACLGETPMTHLVQWRMLLASQRLAQGVSVSLVAEELVERV